MKLNIVFFLDKSSGFRQARYGVGKDLITDDK